VSTTDPNSPQAASSPSLTLAEGKKLAGCYALTRRLTIKDGTEVWLAHDEVLGKDVSLHFVPEAVRKDSRALQELRVDIKRNRQLIHPNILRVYDLVEEPDWVAISMDTFDGESLAQRLSRQAGQGSKVADAKAWVEQLARTLEEAHKINVLHRDLTPSNLLLTSAGKLVVTNFGISRTIHDALARGGAGEHADVAYESPQVLDGKAAAKTDDVYSLGAVLYAVLTGKPPFTGKDLAQQVRAGLPAAALDALRKDDAPAPWQATIAACLDKNPEARPQSAAEVARRLAGGGGETGAVVPAVAPAVKSPAIEPARESAPPATAPAAKPAIEPVASKSTEPAAKEVKKESAASPSTAPAQPQKSPERPLTAEFTPRLYPEESRFPVKGLAIAAGLVILAIIFATSKKPPGKPLEQPAEKTESHAVASPAPVVNSAPSPSPEVAIAKTSTPFPGTSQIAPPSTPPRTPTVVVPKVQTPPPVVPAPSGTEKAIAAEKASALDKAKQAAQAAETTYASLVQQQQAAEASVAEIQKSIEDKTKATAPMKKVAEEAAKQRKKLEDTQKAADAAAADAQKIAAEKARLAEEAKKAVADLEAKNQEQSAAQQRTETEIGDLQKSLTEKQRAAAESAKAVAQAQAAKQQQLAAVAEHEREIEQVKAAELEAQRKKEADEAERRKLDEELKEMKRAFEDKIRAIEEKRKILESPGAARSPQSTPTPATPAPTAPPVVTATTPTPQIRPATPAPAKITAPVPPVRAATPEPIKMANIPATPPSLSVAIPRATSVEPGANSLGMNFVPVGDVDFCVWQTRVKDFEVFAKSVNLKSTSWKGPGFKQGPDHPVVNVSWQESVAFCKWLTDKEHKDNVLAADKFYRLPTDLEWSKAVGLPEESGRTPEARDMGLQDVYPWGNQWPPPPGSGNYTGEETGSDVAIKGYDDGFAWTSPVGSFPPNKFGLYDMGGNVWQWCMDAWNAESKAKVLRGASWYNGALKLSLLSSCRVHAAPDSSTDNYGFRIVRATEPPKPGKK
jgi:serine/threonine protein kinase/formylglycine-generating enzyme required for sulfatase activity